MKTRRAVVLLVIGLAAAGDAYAQRGGRGRGMDFARPETPTSFANDDLGLAFEVPTGLWLFTEAAPGPHKAILGDGRILYLTNPAMRRASVAARVSPGATEAELTNYKAILDVNPPQAKLEGFRKHHVQIIRIGKHQDKEALEFVYDVTQGEMPATIRQVVFVHGGKGFTFTCTSMKAEYGGANATMFKPLFAQLEFR